MFFFSSKAFANSKLFLFISFQNVRANLEEKAEHVNQAFSCNKLTCHKKMFLGGWRCWIPALFTGCEAILRHVATFISKWACIICLQAFPLPEYASVLPNREYPYSLTICLPYLGKSEAGTERLYNSFYFCLNLYPLWAYIFQGVWGGTHIPGGATH